MRPFWQPLPDTLLGALRRGAQAGVFLLGVFTIIDAVSPWPTGLVGWFAIPTLMVIEVTSYLMRKHRRQLGE